MQSRTIDRAVLEARYHCAWYSRALLAGLQQELLGMSGGLSLSRVVALIDMDCFCTPPHTHTLQLTLYATTHAPV